MVGKVRRVLGRVCYWRGRANAASKSVSSRQAGGSGMRVSMVDRRVSVGSEMGRNRTMRQ